MAKRRSESDIMALKAQEAKEYCIELLREIDARSREPLSPGEVQLHELQYELKLKEAEVQDSRDRHAHELRLKELELDIEKERTLHAESTKLADETRSNHAQIIQQVSESQEKLSIQLERATREHNVKLQMMEAEHQEKSEQMVRALDDLQKQREQLMSEIASLANLQVTAEEIANLQSELASRNDAAKRDLKELEDQIESAQFDKKKELIRIQRENDLDIAELAAEHKKLLLEANTETVDKLLSEMGAERIKVEDLKQLREDATRQQKRSDVEVAEIRESAIEDFRKQFNMLGDVDSRIDVTELYYSQKSLREENAQSDGHIAKLEAEISRMRAHIEQESERVAKAIEAARTNIQNTIEPGVKR